VAEALSGLEIQEESQKNQLVPGMDTESAIEID
jgi:hypothetical protein